MTVKVDRFYRHIVGCMLDETYLIYSNPLIVRRPWINALSLSLSLSLCISISIPICIFFVSNKTETKSISWCHKIWFNNIIGLNVEIENKLSNYINNWGFRRLKIRRILFSVLVRSRRNWPDRIQHSLVTGYSVQFWYQQIRCLLAGPETDRLVTGYLVQSYNMVSGRLLALPGPDNLVTEYAV